MWVLVWQMQQHGAFATRVVRLVNPVAFHTPVLLLLQVGARSGRSSLPQVAYIAFSTDAGYAS